MLTEKFYRTGQVTLRYMEGAKNGKSLIFLHDAGAYWRSFSEIIPHYMQDWHILAVDLRGHGQSSRTGEAYRLLNYTTDIVNFVREIAGDKPVLRGQGLGARVALTSAVTMDVVSALILEELRVHDESPPAPTTMLESWISLARRELPPHLIERALRDLRLDVPQVKNGVRVGETRKGDYLHVTAEGISMVDANALTIINHEILPDGYTPKRLLDRVRCPVLFLCGDPEAGSRVTDTEIEQARGFIKQGEVKRITGAGHNVHRTKPDEIIEEAKAFLAGL